MKRRGDLIPPQSWVQYEKTLDVSQGSYAFTTNGTCYEWWQQQWSKATQNSPSYDEATMEGIYQDHRDACAYHVQRAAAQIYSQGWDALTFLAEFKDVYRMFNGLIGKVRGLLKEATLKDVSNQYLEMRYGWRTLMYDIEDITKVINTIEEKRTRFVQRSGGSDITYDSGTFSGQTYGFDWDGSWNSTVEVSYRGTVFADIEPPKIQLNPVTTAWEATKLSFVVDWVVNVGQALEALSFLALVRKGYAANGINVKWELDGQLDGYTLKNGCSIWNGHTPTTNVSHHGEYTYREPTQLSLKPFYHLNLDAFKVLDLIALVKQRMK